MLNTFSDLNCTGRIKCAFKRCKGHFWVKNNVKKILRVIEKKFQKVKKLGEMGGG